MNGNEADSDDDECHLFEDDPPELIRARETLAQLQALKQPPAPKGPLYTEWQPACGGGEPLVFTSHAWRLELDEGTGAIIGLEFLGGNASRESVLALGGGSGGGGGGASWASPQFPLAQLTYSTYNEASYEVIWKDYAYQIPEWFYKDFGKPNATSLGGAARLSVRSLDAALVSPGQPTPFPNVRHLPDLEEGMSFCLTNNIWG